MTKSMQTALLCLLATGLSVPVAAQVSPSAIRYHRSEVTAAEWPEAVLCGAEFTVDVTMTNAARTRWSAEGFYKLGPVKGEDEVFRSDGHKFQMPADAEVFFRGQHTFTLELTAPDEKGTYETHWSMMTGGVAFGTPISQSIRVYCDDAKLGRALFPEEVACGESFIAEVRMRNTGVSTWTETSFYKLGPVEKTNEVFRSDGHKFKMVDFTEVPVGEKYVFELELTAPETAGSYETKWTMMDSGKPFGEEVSRTVEVVCEKGAGRDKKGMGKNGRD